MTYEEALEYAKSYLTIEGVPTRSFEATKCIVEALEKRVTKKPPAHDRTVCPSCNSKAKYGIPYEYYCPHCGQAIDWSDTE